jgi:serine/threonine protein phosphatase PrpC
VSDGKTAVLWGTDHEELDEIAVLGAGTNVALANTRGRHPKAYRYTDPNEDTVAAVVGRQSTLIVCADGHNGALAPNLAVRETLAAFGDDPPATLSEGDWVDLFERINDAVIAGKGIGSEQPASNTVLLVALVSPGRLSWGAIGDGALVVCQPGTQRGRQLNREAMRFIGHPMNRRAVKNTIDRGTIDLAPGDWVVAITDGLSEFVAPLRPADVIPRVLASIHPLDAAAAARALVETACSAGAGDNVATAVVGPA